jgi:hypothetical protein
MQLTCVVNSVGPTSGNWEASFLDPRADPTTYGPIIVLKLTALDNKFESFNFVVATEVSNFVLAVALAAINTGKQVLADVDWPQPIIGKAQGGSNIYGPAYCHSLWLNAG